MTQPSADRPPQQCAVCGAPFPNRSQRRYCVRCKVQRLRAAARQYRRDQLERLAHAHAQEAR